MTRSTRITSLLGALALLASEARAAELTAEGGSHARPSHAETCQADAARLCAGVAPGEGRIRECLRAGSATLAPACQKRLARAAKAAAPEAQAEAQVVEEAALEQREGVEPAVEPAPEGGGEEGKEQK